MLSPISDKPSIDPTLFQAAAVNVYEHVEEESDRRRPESISRAVRTLFMTIDGALSEL